MKQYVDTGIKLGQRQLRFLRNLAGTETGEWDPMDWLGMTNTQLRTKSRIFASMQKHGFTEPLGRGAFQVFGESGPRITMGWRITSAGRAYVEALTRERRPARVIGTREQED